MPSAASFTVVICHTKYCCSCAVKQTEIVIAIVMLFMLFFSFKSVYFSACFYSYSFFSLFLYSLLNCLESCFGFFFSLYFICCWIVALSWFFLVCLPSHVCQMSYIFCDHCNSRALSHFVFTVCGCIFSWITGSFCFVSVKRALKDKEMKMNSRATISND